jgi:acetyl-CoA carboxylase biotin carboxylase subunit
MRSVLVANRGEIALRVIRACRDLGMRAVAVYSDVDRDALHVRAADEAYPIGRAAPSESYLNAARLIEVARRADCDAVHPGYGFLSENPAFAQAVADAGLVFVGPPAAVQRLLGEKTAARRLAREARVPVAEGTEPLSDLAAAQKAATALGYPVMLKPAGGGGGKGMRLVSRADDLPAAWRGATGEATTAFGRPELYLERAVQRPRHVEMQILGDARGDVVWLGERDCSIQRRHQKLIEETPGPVVDEGLRAKLGEAAVRIAKAARYENAGTVEFLVDAERRFYFLEVNTRLQVEHPVTEMVTGLDLVALQLRIASGEALPFAQPDVRRVGAAVECRITAEDPYAGFLPSGGRIEYVREPAGPGVRVDAALYAGMTVPTEYDPLLAKVIAHGRDRAEALARMRRALAELRIAGIPTSVPFHRHVFAEPDFIAGAYDTAYIPAHWPPPERSDLPEDSAAAVALAAVLAERGRTERRAAVAPETAWARAGREDALR